MPRLRWTRLLSLALVSVMPLGALAPGCTSSNTSTIGQKISCKDTGAGVANCHPVDSGTVGTGSDTCEDVDDDGDGTPHDEGEDAEDGVHDGSSADRDDDGTADSADDDDDGDGVSDDRDCDKRPGGDDDGVGSADVHP
jgi:hypothetical protein